MILLTLMIGRLISDSVLVHHSSNQWSPSLMSTTGRLFIRYLDSSSSMVMKVSELCSARNGTQWNNPKTTRLMSSSMKSGKVVHGLAHDKSQPLSGLRKQRIFDGALLPGRHVSLLPRHDSTSLTAHSLLLHRCLDGIEYENLGYQ
jgi:hypothetical protein